MDRREHLKLLFAGSLGAGFFFTRGCTDEDLATSEQIIAQNGYGRTPDEAKRDEELRSETFFSDAEREMVEILSDIIIPADDVSGSATDAGVPDFIEFMMKDMPSLQVPTRGGLMWLNNRALSLFDKAFASCTPDERLELIDEIAWPDDAEPNAMYGVRFFNRMRDLVATGFFTSQIGVEDIGYQGNTPGFWDGVPDEVLRKHGFRYDQKTVEECIKQEERGIIAEWDEEGNLTSRGS
ncbi:MAG: gluconate 2-dehydrogenase subunit 3 family protein [Balneolaceae bacterium]